MNTVVYVHCTMYSTVVRPAHKRRFYTEEKVKVVVAVWGTNYIQFLAALAVLHQDDMKIRMNLSYSSNCPGAK